MFKKNVGILLSLAGIGLSFISLFADQIGLGDVDPDHFVVGSKQIAGIVAGGLFFLAGVFIWKKNN
ncbi:MAG: hypothetical protein KKE44_16360 [Proteobacteria bacterium]|nr:hypothetical protein [Pseudomonadota bacterium]MBU1584303.1 hypothetical protein [Pseudomonadota bacterium]MBU2628375.1 hypothetical protein [Pseudomonadota bacterium]